MKKITLTEAELEALITKAVLKALDQRPVQIQYVPFTPAQGNIPQLPVYPQYPQYPGTIPSYPGCPSPTFCQAGQAPGSVQAGIDNALRTYNTADTAHMAEKRMSVGMQQAASACGCTAWPCVHTESASNNGGVACTCQQKPCEHTPGVNRPNYPW